MPSGARTPSPCRAPSPPGRRCSRSAARCRFADLLEPAAQMAEEGVAVAPSLAKSRSTERSGDGDLEADEGMNERVPPERPGASQAGDALVQPALARTLRALQANGAGRALPRPGRGGDHGPPDRRSGRAMAIADLAAHATEVGAPLVRRLRHRGGADGAAQLAGADAARDPRRRDPSRRRRPARRRRRPAGRAVPADDDRPRPASGRPAVRGRAGGGAAVGAASRPTGRGALARRRRAGAAGPAGRRRPATRSRSSRPTRRAMRCHDPVGASTASGPASSTRPRVSCCTTGARSSPSIPRRRTCSPAGSDPATR